jgi:hypothetical protein
MAKAQADIVSAVIIVLIALSLTATALIWGLPLIQKRQDSAIVARVSNLFSQELPSKIKYVANVGGSEVFSLDANGIWILNSSSNTLTFTFFSKVSDKAVDIGRWIGPNCISTGVNTSNPGTLGIDEPCLICVRSDTAGTGYNITYQLGCRQLVGETKNYKINLVSSGVTTSTAKTIRISRKSVSQSDNLIITEIEISL